MYSCRIIGLFIGYTWYGTYMAEEGTKPGVDNSNTKPLPLVKIQDKSRMSKPAFIKKMTNYYGFF